MGRGSGRDQSRSLLEDTAILLGTDEPAAVPAFVEIIEIAQTGERDPTRMCQLVLKAIGIAPG